MGLELREPDTAELCRDAEGHRNLRAERLLDEKERLSRRLGWAIRKGDVRRAQHLERRLAELEQDMRTPADGYAREISHQRDKRRRAF